MLAEGTALEVTLPGEQVGHACGAQRSQPPARGGFGVGQALACGSSGQACSSAEQGRAAAAHPPAGISLVTAVTINGRR